MSTECKELELNKLSMRLGNGNAKGERRFLVKQLALQQLHYPLQPQHRFVCVSQSAPTTRLIYCSTNQRRPSMCIFVC